MAPHKNLAIIAIICFIVVASMTTIRIRQVNLSERPQTLRTRVIPPYETSSTPAADKSFFESGQKKEPTAVVPPKNPHGITARAYIAGNLTTGKIYINLNNTRALPVASMSKLVTAFAANDQYSSSTMIEIISGLASSTPPDSSNLRDGEKFSLSELLYPLLLSSSNVAAEAIASSSNRGVFQELMSSYAWEVGMPQSFFADPSGISPHNIASGNDLFALARYLYVFRPDVLAITRTASISIASSSDHYSHEVVSTHPFVNDPRFIGGKTGRTQEAGETMMTVLNIAGEPVAFIVLGSRYGMRETDTRILVGLVEKMLR